ncbi:sugar kinase [Ornithinicoccus halotolerans]|uniref:sugar kinase n=1 Tax=Ornithinicoccus halotolerans TaxID=1748220 RepID=UPI001E2B4E3B|nr:sugar kinase [Ornithinicoccus halotolerans]
MTATGPVVVTAGETMLLGIADPPGRLRHARSLAMGIGGAESNLAIGLSRLGVPSRWVSLLGDDEPGQTVLDRVRAEGVDTSAVRRVPGRPTGLYLREEVGGAVRVTYYRAGSAAATLAPEAVDAAALTEGRWLHLTGITPLLSASCADFVRWAAQAARDAGVRVSFDVNYRSRLGNAEDARAFTEELLPLVDLLLVGTEEGRALWDWRDDETQSRTLADMGAREVVVKRGAEGAAVLVDGQWVEHPGFRVPERDPIGAGDAFAAGYLAAHVDGAKPADRLRTANALGALCVRAHGDFEGLPSRRELDDFLHDRTDLGR